MAQLTIRQRIVVRVPAMPLAPPPKIESRRWKESKGPKCIPMNALAGAAVMRPDTVELLLRGGRRVRAVLDDECPALDFYRGFYLMPSADGQVCRKRDLIRSRAGGQCTIDKFRLLTLEKPSQP